MQSTNYAILRLIPNARRQEIINIGLVLFLEDGFKFRISKNFGKIRALCPSYQLDLFPTLEDDVRFLAGPDADYDEIKCTLNSLGGFVLGPESTVSHVSQANLSEKIEDLMNAYVYPETNVADHQPLTLFHELRKEIAKITELSSSRTDLENFQIVERYAIDNDGWLQTEFAYKTDVNTVFIQTVDLRVSDRRELFRTISARKIVGEAIRELFDGKAEILVAYRISDSARAVGGDQLISLIRKYASEICDFENADEMRTLTNRIAWTYGPNKSLPLFH